jgi:DNA-directed RNA polymerase subunit RPC12/RpoP
MTMKTEPIREAYSFVCLRCGHAWEGTYEIRHTRDAEGHLRVEYYARFGMTVPSPLTDNTCRVCGGRRIRILRSGRVDSAHPSPQ